MNNSSAGSGLSVVAGGNPGNGSNKLLSLKDGGSNEKFTVLDNGNVGIGTTTPTSNLTVNGATNSAVEIQYAGTSKGYLWWDYATNGGILGVGPGTSNTSIIFKNGNIGIGQTAPTYKLDVAGAAQATAWNIASDRRLKDNIVNTHFGIADLMKIPVRDYTYKADAANTPTTGFIAQELYEIFPNAVTKPANAKDMWSVDYGKVTPLLVKGMQELKAENDGLKSENEVLKARLLKIEKALGL